MKAMKDSKGSLRTPTTNDYVTLASWIDNADAAERWAGPRLLFPFDPLNLSAALAIPDCSEASYSLIDHRDQLCGFGQHWVVEPGAVHLGRLIIDPAARGKGWGRVLCEHIIAAALDVTQARAVTLKVFRDNAPALHLYTDLGFAEVDAYSTERVHFMRMVL